MILPDFRATFLRNAVSQVGRDYIWGGKGLFVLDPATGGIMDCPKDERGLPLAVYDCSGLVTWAAKQSGARDLTRSWHTGRMRDELKTVQTPQPGDLALYPQHVEIVLCTVDGLTMTVGASGGTSKTLTIPLARAVSACVRVKKDHRTHPGFIGFRNLTGLFEA